MNFEPIDNLVKKSIVLDEEIDTYLMQYSDYLASRGSPGIAAAAIISGLLKNEKLLNSIEEKQEPRKRNLQVKIPEKAWQNAEETAERTNLDPSEIISILVKELVSKRDFKTWKKKVLQK